MEKKDQREWKVNKKEEDKLIERCSQKIIKERSIQLTTTRNYLSNK